MTRFIIVDVITWHLISCGLLSSSISGVWKTVGNPFGYSARRIGDLAAGLSGKWKNTNAWKKHRVTKHTHHPLDDDNGNREALIHILNKYGQKFDRMGNE